MINLLERTKIKKFVIFCCMMRDKLFRMRFSVALAHQLRQQSFYRPGLHVLTDDKRRKWEKTVTKIESGKYLLL